MAPGLQRAASAVYKLLSTQKGEGRDFFLTFDLLGSCMSVIKTCPVQIIKRSPHPLPAYKTEGAAGLDIQVHIPEGRLMVEPMQRAQLHTGLFIALPAGYQAEVRSRSGLASRHGVVVLNSPGTIDADYRGEIMLLVANLSNAPFEVRDGDCMGQLVVTQYEQVIWEEVDSLPATLRGEQGFGSTGGVSRDLWQGD